MDFSTERERLLEDKRDKIERDPGRKEKAMSRKRGFSMIEVLLALTIGGLVLRRPPLC